MTAWQSQNACVAVLSVALLCSVVAAQSTVPDSGMCPLTAKGIKAWEDACDLSNGMMDTCVERCFCAGRDVTKHVSPNTPFASSLLLLCRETVSKIITPPKPDCFQEAEKMAEKSMTQAEQDKMCAKFPRVDNAGLVPSTGGGAAATDAGAAPVKGAGAAATAGLLEMVIVGMATLLLAGLMV